ncbi:hypothetical protein FEM48_Zijuj03G0172900 [Ziziphus jujuba var. spinosa]|uniref:Cyclic nucleotide-gated ion channel 1-like n=1 Tax=Ziziphus jujuba var. spinosa TaxID=714518 RepID=A0A978VRL8_ZIZJJ|nr:hypothetical protein FEM48_Zijuj03G0172900 [Ziziphus jujuba var. spinosa]
MRLSVLELKLWSRAPGPMVKVVSNFLLSVTAGHTACWHNACRHHGSGCISTTFDCNEDISVNRTILNDFCPINPPNATVFDFGIFLDALQQGVLGPMDFTKKFLQCYWWGLRNLRLYTVEQTCRKLAVIGSKKHEMQVETTKRNFVDAKEMIPENMKAILLRYVRRKLEDKKDIDVKNLLSILPIEYKESLKKHFCLASLEKWCTASTATLLERKNHAAKNDDNGSSYGFTSFKRLERGDYYGEELIKETLTSPNLVSSFPISSLNVKSHTKVEALVLTANDLMAFKFKHDWLFTNKHSTDPTETKSEWASHAIQNVWRRHVTDHKAQTRLLLH